MDQSINDSFAFIFDSTLKSLNGLAEIVNFWSLAVTNLVILVTIHLVKRLLMLYVEGFFLIT